MLLQTSFCGDRYEEEFAGYDLEIFKVVDSLFYTYQYDASYAALQTVLDQTEINENQFIYGIVRKAILQRKLHQLNQSQSTFQSIYHLMEDTTNQVKPLKAFYFHNYGELYEFLNVNDSAYLFLEKAIHLKKEIYGQNSCYLAESLLEMGELFFYHIFEYNISKTYANEALKIIQTCNIKQSNLTSLCYFLLGNLYWQSYEFETAIQFLDHAIAHESNQTVVNGSILAYMHSSLSRILLNAKYFESSVQYAETAIQLLEKYDPNNISNYYYFNYNLAIALYSDKQYSKAIKLLKNLIQEVGNNSNYLDIKNEYKFQLARNYGALKNTTNCKKLIFEIYEIMLQTYGGFCNKSANQFVVEIIEILIDIDELSLAHEKLNELVKCYTSQSNNTNFDHYELAYLYELKKEILLENNSYGDLNVTNTISDADSLYLLAKLENIWNLSKIIASEDDATFFYGSVIKDLFQYYQNSKNKNIIPLIFKLTESAKMAHSMNL